MLVAAVAVVGACSPAPADDSARHPPDSRPARTTLVLTIDQQLDHLGAWFLGPPGGSADVVAELYHSGLATRDERGEPVARLAVSLPSFDDGTWTLSADGTMETTYQLRADAVWHDGAPLTADDVVLGHQLRDALGPGYRTPLLATIVEVRALDARTVVVHWDRFHWGARAVRAELAPLPRHLLGGADRQSAEDLLRDPYWTTGYVGLGPYRAADFSPGSVRLVAHDRYHLGRPGIGSILVESRAGAATTKSALIEGRADLAVAPSLAAPDALDLRATWEAEGRGRLLIYPRSLGFALFGSPGARSPPALGNRAVRRALGHALNRAQTSFAGSLGLAPPPASWIPPTDPRWDTARPYVDDDLPYDPRRAFQLLADAGWTRGADGKLRDGDRPLGFELRHRDAPALQASVARYWSEIGATLDLTSEDKVGAAADTPGVLVGSSGAAVPDQGVLVGWTPLDAHLAPRLLELGRWPSPQPGSRWTSEVDSLITSIDVGERRDARLETERALLRELSREVPFVPLSFGVEIVPLGPRLQGILRRSGLDLEPWVTFNGHEWTTAAR